MSNKKETLGLRIFLGSLVSEFEKLYGRPTINTIIYRIGQKPGEIVAKQILKKYDRNEEEPFETPSSAFNLLEGSLVQLFTTEFVDFDKDEEKQRYTIKIKNVCPMRTTIMGREDLQFGGTLCQFTRGYFESALKMLTGMDVTYNYIEKETTDEYCVIKLVFEEKERKDLNKSAQDQTEEKNNQ